MLAGDEAFAEGSWSDSEKVSAKKLIMAKEEVAKENMEGRGGWRRMRQGKEIKVEENVGVVSYLRAS